MSKDKNNFKVGLALSGGVALGFTHIGVLQALKDHGIEINLIAGTSAGALIAAMYAFDVPIKEMMDEASQMKWSKISKFSLPKLGLFSNAAMRSLIEKYIDKSDMESAKIPLAIVAADIQTGEMVVLKNGNVADAIMASTALPGIFAPVEIDGRLLVDGGLTGLIPIAPLKEMDADIIIAVDLTKKYYRRPKNIVNVMFNAFAILNCNLARTYKETADVLIKPDVTEYSATNFKNLAHLVNEGYRATVFSMPAIKKSLEAKRMEKKSFAGRFFGKIFKRKNS